jgi:transcriptional regulator with XRE-family HTH domain
MSTSYRLCATRLEQAAEAKGDRTSYAIAKRTGLAQSTVNRLRQGLVRPATSSLLALSAAYGLSVEDLIEQLTVDLTRNGDGSGVAAPNPLAETHDSTF